MSEASVEKRSIQTEPTKREESFTPQEQDLAVRVERDILRWLDQMKLPDEDVEIITRYAKEAARLAVEERRRLREESPAGRIIAAFQEELSSPKLPVDQKVLIQTTIDRIKEQVKNWQDSVERARGIAIIRGESNKPTEDIVNELIEGKGGMGRIIPVLGSCDTDKLDRWGDVTKRMANAKTATSILQRLGFLSEKTSVQLLFALPVLTDKRTVGERASEERWKGTPTRVSEDTVVGLRSPRIPGVAVDVLDLRDRVSVRFNLLPEAVAKSITEVSGPSVT